MTESVLNIKELNIRYEKAAHPAIQNLTMEVKEGEFVGVMGANGAGKTTLSLACIGVIPGFIDVEMDGEINVLGADITQVMVEDVATRGVGIVFQQPDMQLISVNVELEIAFAMENRQFQREEMRRRIDSALELVRLKGYEKYSPEQLSGGQKQAVCIAIALTMEPKLIILDEPTSQLDPIGSDIVFQALADINKNQNIAILIMEHKAELLSRYADRIIVLDKGQKIYDGTPTEVFKHAEDIIQRGIPVPQVNELAVKMDDLFTSEFIPLDEQVTAEKIIELIRGN
jgi:energy-coupling factor transporter ATP-binding protein EcfA2